LNCLEILGTCDFCHIIVPALNQNQLFRSGVVA